MSFRSAPAVVAVIAVVTFSLGIADAATGPKGLQRLAAAQTQLLMRQLDAATQNASPARCNVGQDDEGMHGTFLLPTFAGAGGNAQFKCHIESRKVLIDLGGAFIWEDNRPDTSFWIIDGHEVPFTKANLERICDDVLLKNTPSPAPATVDGETLTGATAVSTGPFTSRVRSTTGQLYQDSVDVGHPGRLASAYCGWKAVVPLSPGHHLIKVDLSTIAPVPTIFSYRITVKDDEVHATGSHVIRPSQSVEQTGRTYGQWSAKWWQYALSIPRSTNPLLDPTGRQCGHKQSGPVFFLAGTFTSTTAPNGDVNGTAKRSQCVVPEHRVLFFPILNAECSTAEGNGTTYAALRACAKTLVDPAMNLAVEVDGRRLRGLTSATTTKFRAPSPLFTYHLPANNILGLTGPQSSRSVADGVYVMLQPLPVGRHSIHIHGQAPISATNTFTLDVTYRPLIVRDDD